MDTQYAEAGRPPSGNGRLWRNSLYGARRALSGEARRAHLAWLILGAVLVLTPFLPHRHAMRLVPVCLFHAFTGLPCVFCGYTRAFIALARGEWLAALTRAPMALFFYALAWGILLVNLGALAFRLRITPGPLWRRRLLLRVLLTVVIILLFFDWGYRVRREAAGRNTAFSVVKAACIN